MKALHFVCLWSLLFISLAQGDPMDISGVNELVTRMENAFPRGNIYHISYVDYLKRTDAYYARNQESIKYLEDQHAETIKSIIANPRNKDLKDPEARFRDLVNIFRKPLSDPREVTVHIDYCLDGKGFVLKQESSYLNAKGVKGSSGPTIYASDGTIMGSFFKDSQAVIQPATERPPCPLRDWNDIAYNFFRKKFSTIMRGITDLAVTHNENEIVITGEFPQKELAHTHLEFRVNEVTLQPAQMICINYNSFGKLYQKCVKTWQFQDYSGISMPKCVVEQTYHSDLKDNLNLEQEETFTLNEYSPQVQSAKEKLASLLKSNYSIYDEITGSHYISGNPEDTLNNLSH